MPVITDTATHAPCRSNVLAIHGLANEGGINSHVVFMPATSGMNVPAFWQHLLAPYSKHKVIYHFKCMYRYQVIMSVNAIGFESSSTSCFDFEIVA
jgi:hypothetical protein